MSGTPTTGAIPASRTVALTHALLIDGTGRPPVTDATILIEDGTITAVGAGLTVPPGIATIDLVGRTVIPGLIDAHVHLGAQVHIPDFSKTVFMGGSETIFGGAAFTDNFLSARQDSLRYGLTTVRSCGDFLHDVLALRDAVESGAVLGPRVVAAGPSFQVQDGHPNATVWGSDPETLREAARLPETAEEAVRMVEDLAGKGVDFIKVIVENGKIGKRKGAFRKLSWEIVGAIVEAAHRAGLKVTSHIENLEDATRAVALGIDEISHLVLHEENIDEPAFDALFRDMAARGTFLIATMVVTAKPMPLPISAIDIRGLHFGNRLVRRAHELGVKVGAGTDAGAPELRHGWALHAEIALMVNDQGIPAVEAIKAATLVNAELADIADKVGSVEPGKCADLVVLSANPIDDILNTMKIEQVMLAGRFIDLEQGAGR